MQLIGVDVGGTYINDYFRMLRHSMPRSDSNDSKPPTVP